MAQNLQALMDLSGAQPIKTSLSQPKKTINFQSRPDGSSPSVTPQCRFKPQNVSAFATTAALDSSKSREMQQAKSGRLMASTGLQMPQRSNINNQNSQIHGRKVDSPKIYVKDDVSEGRPKTSAQAPRKTGTQQQQLGQKQKNYNSKRQGFKPQGGSAQLFSQANSGGLTSKESTEARRFDFTFATEHRNRDGKLVNQLPSSATAKQTTNVSSHNIQFEGQIGNHPKTTSNAALSSNPLLYGALSKYQSTRQNAQNNISSNNGRMHQVREAKIGSNQATRKRIQSAGVVQKQISGVGVNKQSLPTSTVATAIKEQPTSVNLQLQVHSPQCGGKSVRINNKLPPRHSKLQKQKEVLPSKRSKRTRSTDQTSRPTLAAAQRSKGSRKPRLNQTLISNVNGGHLAGAVNTTRAATGSNHCRSHISNSVGQSLNKTTLAGGGKQVNHFSFELDNKENLVSNSSQQNFGPLSDKGQANKSGSASRSRGRSRHAGKMVSADHNDISLSSLSGQSKELRGDVSLSGNMSKMFNKNYFVDGEQLLRQLSPGTPSRSDDQMKSLMSAGVNSSAVAQHEKSKKGAKSPSNKKMGVRKPRNSLGGHKGSSDNVLNLSNKAAKVDTKVDTTKRSQKNAHALLKKFMEETQRKTERDRHERSEERKRLQDMVRNKYKKTRSKSCISKVDPHAAVFSGRKEKDRDKSNEVHKNAICLLSEPAKEIGSCRRTGQRERSCVLELNQLKKELNEEIRRERKEGLGCSDVMSGGNLSATNQKSRPISTRVKGEINRQSMNVANSSTPVYNSLRRAEAGVLIDRINKEEKQKKQKELSKTGEMNNSKIRRFIEKQKKRLKAKKSLEQTIEYEKSLRIKQTLIDLQNFSRTGERKEKPICLRSSNQININKITSQTGKNSSQQIQLLDHVRNHLPRQNLKPQHQKKSGGRYTKHSIQTDRLPESPNSFIEYDPNKDLGEGADLAHRQRSFQDDIDEQANVVKMFGQDLGRSESPSRRHSSSKHRNRRDDNSINYPLKEVGKLTKKPKMHDISPSSNGYSNSAKLNHNLVPQNIKLQSHTVHDLDSSNERRTIRDDAFDSINNGKGYPSKQQNISGLGSSDFESIEPSRPVGDKKGQFNRSSPKNPVNNSTVSDLYDQSGLPVSRKYQQNDYEDLLEEHAAIIIQRFAKDYFLRKTSNQARERPGPPIEIDSSSEEIPPNSKQDPNTTSQSVRKSVNIPNLDLKKINSSETNPHRQLIVDMNQNAGAISSARSTSIFDRDSFAQFKVSNLKPKDDGSLPELIKVREEAIQYRQIQEQNFLAQEFSQKKFSPRTYKLKQRELETWVTKEREEVKKTKKVFEQEWEKTAKIINSTTKDTQQVKSILGSARSSNKLRLDDSSHPMVSSARTGLNSIRIDSQRKTQRIEESKLIDMIYDRQGGERLPNESSSQSHNDHESNPSQSHQNSHSSYHEELEQEHYGDERTERSDKLPNFDKVVVFNTTGTRDQKKQRNNLGEVDDFFNGKGPQIKSFDDAILAEPSSEHTLQRVTSYKNLDKKIEIEEEKENLIQLTNGSPRHLSKTDATSKLPDVIDEEEADLARQVMEVSSAQSNSSQSPIKDELKESLRSQNFFLNKMDGQGQSPKGAINSSLNTRADSSNIRIEISGEMQNKSNNQDQTVSGMTNILGAVSPLSGASSDFGIQRGSVSLESSTSGEQRQQLQQVIAEVSEDQQIGAKTEELTDEIMQLLVAEMRLDFDFMISRRDSRSLQDEEEQHQQVQGIKTDLFAIEKYVDEVVEEIKANQNEFMKSLNEPLERDVLQVLNKMQTNEIGSCEHFDEKFPQILPLELYLCLEKRRKEARERQIEDQGTQKVADGRPNSQAEMLKILLAECEHIHNKVLFDCINDSLLQFKPYGKEGEPLPWGRKNRRLKPTDDFTLSEVFEIVKHDLFRWAITNAGTLPRREYVYRGIFDEDLWQDVREKKLIGLLGREMIESEPKWLNYEFEQAQVKIDTGDMILEALMGEAIQIMNEIGQRDFSGHPLLDSDAEGEGEEQDALELPESRRVSGSSRLSGQRSVDPHDYSRDSDFSNNNMSDDD